jgi:hypothetical protein
MKTKLLSMALLAGTMTLFAQKKDSIKSQIPFEGMDQTWQNGSDRRDSCLLQNKWITGIFMLDANATYSGTNPIDHTVVGSTALARDNEMEVSDAVIGADISYDGARGRILTQFGTRSEVVPRNDLSPYRGQYDLADAYRYISEAYGGYHFNVMHGINVDGGMFMSYVGLNSYYQVENWEYQASYTSDNTPWFFNGIRVQIFPSKYLKIEPWLINGWQSYGTFNAMPGFGGNITWCPKESIKLLTNDYYGTDDAGYVGRHRWHSDNSLLVRYYNEPKKLKGITKMAFSATFDIGAESGDGVTGFKPDNAANGTYAQNFVSWMVYNRIWFAKNKLAWCIGGGWMTNPGDYLVLAPTGQASPMPNPYNPTQGAGLFPFNNNPGSSFTGWDCSTNISWMPNQSFEFRLEYVHRHSSVPYFAGSGGVTSSTGYTTTLVTNPGPWSPDLVNFEDRIIMAVLVRF